VLWGARGLPSDASQLMAVPRGGALVLCQNMILYYTQVRLPDSAKPDSMHWGPQPALFNCTCLVSSMHRGDGEGGQSHLLDGGDTRRDRLESGGSASTSQQEMSSPLYAGCVCCTRHQLQCVCW